MEKGGGYERVPNGLNCRGVDVIRYNLFPENSDYNVTVHIGNFLGE